MDLTTIELAGALAAVFAGAVVQSAIGFGLAVVASPILFMINPSLVPSSLIVMGFMVGLLNVRRYFGSMQLDRLKYAVMGRVPGSLVGMVLLFVASVQQLSLILGVSVILAVLASVSPFKLEANKKTLFGAGFLSGVMGTTSSIGGPAIALVMLNEPADRIKANMAAYFSVSSAISIILLCASGLFTWWHLKYALYLVPAVFLGNYLASKVSHRIDEKAIRPMLLIMCSVAGASAIATAIR